VALSAYGLSITPAFDLPAARADSLPFSPGVTLQLGDMGALARRWSGSAGPAVWLSVSSDGCRVRLEHGRNGDWRLWYGRRAVFHLCAAGCTLLCAPEDPADLGWMRFLLDTGLRCASSVHGFEALHASAISTPAGTVAFIGEAGSGKSVLAAELVARGYPLVCDDVLTVSRDRADVLGHPGPPLMNLPFDGPIGPADIGDVLGEFPGETWIQVPGTERTARPIAATCILERRPGAVTSMSRVEGSSLALLPHSLGFKNTRVRTASSFSLLRRLATGTPVYRLEADPGADIEEVAWAVEETLAPTASLAATG
jgi:hypothetical protein